jgi:hypothetical protein
MFSGCAKAPLLQSPRVKSKVAIGNSLKLEDNVEQGNSNLGKQEVSIINPCILRFGIMERVEFINCTLFLQNVYF